MLTVSQYITERTRWKVQAAKGNLSNKALKRLTKAGVRKPVVNHLQGYDRGTQNIINKNASSNVKNTWGGQYYISPYKKGKHSVHGDKKDKNTNFLSKRHEANETVAVNKRQKKIGHYQAGINFVNSNSASSFQGTVGIHASPKVLKKEYEDRKSLEAQYPHLKNQSNIKFLKNFRKKSGEKLLQKKSWKEMKKLEDKINKNEPEIQKKSKQAWILDRGLKRFETRTNKGYEKRENTRKKFEEKENKTKLFGLKNFNKRKKNKEIENPDKLDPIYVGKQKIKKHIKKLKNDHHRLNTIYVDKEV